MEEAQKQERESASRAAEEAERRRRAEERGAEAEMRWLELGLHAGNVAEVGRAAPALSSFTARVLV